MPVLPVVRNVKRSEIEGNLELYIKIFWSDEMSDANFVIKDTSSKT
jgi:hypothetical protein